VSRKVEKVENTILYWVGVVGRVFYGASRVVLVEK